MNRAKTQNAAIHDKYYNKKYSLTANFLVRLALLCGLSASAAASICHFYGADTVILKACGAAALAAAGLYLLASVIPSWLAYILTAGGFALAVSREAVLNRLSYFFDFIMIRLESRLLNTEQYVIHDLERLKSGYYGDEVTDGVLLGFILAGMAASFLFVMSSRARFRPLTVMIIYAAAVSPAFIAEKAGYHYSFALFTAFYFALYAVRMTYEADAFFVFETENMAKEAVRRSEKTYRRRSFFTFFGEKLKGDIPRYFRYGSTSVLALIVTAAVVISTGAVVPANMTFDYEKIFNSAKELGNKASEKFEDIFGTNLGTGKAAKEYFSYSQYGDNSGGIEISRPSDSERPVLGVTLERNDIPVYLRGDIGVSFNGESWTALKDEYSKNPYYKQIEDFYPESMYQVARQISSYYGFDPDSFLPLQKVSIDYLRKTGVVFQPLAAYELDYKDSEYFESYGDTVFRTNGRKYLNTYESLALTPNMSFLSLRQFINDAASAGNGDWTIPGGVSADQYHNYMESYLSYCDMYKKENNTVIDGLVAELYELGYLSGGMDRYSAADGICRYFKDNFSYSLTVDNGDDVLDSFLYKTKEGHCALFATSATLALRRLGIPARYVTGYVVSGQGEKTADGYAYTLREKDLHAWVEVYFKNIGWLPFDPTAAVSGYAELISGQPQTGTEPPVSSVPENTEPDVSYSGGATEEPDISAPDTSVSGGEADATKPPVTDAENDERNDEIITTTEEKRETNIIPVLIIMGVILAAAVIVLALRAFVKRIDSAEKRAFGSFRNSSPDKAAAEMYKLCMNILSREGLVPECEMMIDFAERVDASIFLKGLNIFMVDVMPVFIKCEFGNPDISPVTEEERALVYKFTAVMYRKFTENLGGFKKLAVKAELFLK